MEARHLHAGDLAVTAQRKTLELLAVVVDARYETVYNFSVEGDHNYYVGDAQILVHNQPYVLGARLAGGALEGILVSLGLVAAADSSWTQYCATNPTACGGRSEIHVGDRVTINGYTYEVYEQGGTEYLRPMRQSYEEIWEGAEPTDDDNRKIRQKEGDFEDANKNFDSIPGEAQDYGHGVRVKVLPDGSRVIVRPHSKEDGRPTLELQQPNGRWRRKLRYGSRNGTG